jgi:hypothetical protein
MRTRRLLVFPSLVIAIFLALAAQPPLPCRAGCGPGQVTIAQIEAPGDGHFLGMGCYGAGTCGCGADPCSNVSIGVPDGKCYGSGPAPTSPPPPPPAPSLSIDAVCAVSTSRTFEVSVVSGATRTLRVSNGFSQTLAAGQASVTVSGLAYGSYTATASSSNGNGTSTSSPLSFSVDLEAPTTSFSWN